MVARVRDIMPEVSRATIYNTLRLFADAGLVKELVIDPERTVFDSNTSHHHHLYEVDTGKLTDIPSGELHVSGTAGLPDDVELEAVDVVLRVRRKPA
jgi:Fur family iron response transcriptional regulator